MTNEAPLIGVSRHRLRTDGEGVTTLVAFHGCPLLCDYCLNPQCLQKNGAKRTVTVSQLVEELAVDNLYFLATNGGITFGGGEPLLYAKFIQAFHQHCPEEWRICIETCLNVPLRSLETVYPFVAEFIIDIKDANAEIYEEYTMRSNSQVTKNLKWIASQPEATAKVLIRLPLIPGYNTEDDVKASRQKMKELGFTRFDEFTYIIKHPKRRPMRGLRGRI